MSEAQLDEHAAHAAEYFWWTVRQNLSDGKLFRDDLEGILNDQGQADHAFALFDLDGAPMDTFAHLRRPRAAPNRALLCRRRVCDRGGGAQPLPEDLSVRATARATGMPAPPAPWRPVTRSAARRERRDMAITLENTEVVLATLEALVGGIMHVVGVFSYLAIFGVDVGHLVLSLSSMTLALAFIFGNSLRTIYESVVFLFVVRPYKVGDAIWYEDSLHRVSSFGLLWTELYRYDGNRLSVRTQCAAWLAPRRDRAGALHGGGACCAGAEREAHGDGHCEHHRVQSDAGPRDVRGGCSRRHARTCKRSRRERAGRDRAGAPLAPV